MTEPSCKLDSVSDDELELCVHDVTNPPLRATLAAVESSEDRSFVFPLKCMCRSMFGTFANSLSPVNVCQGDFVCFYC